jgi:hypothetical protein
VLCCGEWVGMCVSLKMNLWMRLSVCVGCRKRDKKSKKEKKKKQERKEKKVKIRIQARDAGSWAARPLATNAPSTLTNMQPGTSSVERTQGADQRTSSPGEADNPRRERDPVVRRRSVFGPDSCG